MRITRVSAIFLTAAIKASAQDILGALTDSVPNAALTASSSAGEAVTMTEYYDDCPSGTGAEYSATVTGTIISTYCPKCEMSETTSEGILTVYTTEYSQLCPTGLEPVIYTVTESCSSTGASREATYVPQGFTVTTVECTVCENMPMVTITTPIATLSAGSAPAATYVAPTASGTSSPGATPAAASAPAPGAASPAAAYAASAATPITTAIVETGTITVESSPASTGAPGAPVEAPYVAPAGASPESPAGSNSSVISPPINYATGSGPRMVIDVSFFFTMAILGAFHLAI
ncbi:Mucin-5B [Xylographa carneopallida]|nr:Mucin-5B [Xylographa carneopallida]